MTIEDEPLVYKHDLAATLTPFAGDVADQHFMDLFGIATRAGRELQRLNTTFNRDEAELKASATKRIRDKELEDVAGYISSHGGVGLLAGLEKYWADKPADKKTGFSLANTYTEPERRRIARIVINTEEKTTSDPKRRVDLFVLGTNLRTIF